MKDTHLPVFVQYGTSPINNACYYHCFPELDSNFVETPLTLVLGHRELKLVGLEDSPLWLISQQQKFLCKEPG